MTVSRIQLYILLSQAASFQDCVDAGGRANYFKGCVSNTSTTKLLRLADDLHADLKYYQGITDPAFGINKGVLDATDDDLVAFATGKKKEVVFWAWDPAGTKSANPNTFNTNGTLRPVLSLLDEPKSCPHKPPLPPCRNLLFTRASCECLLWWISSSQGLSAKLFRARLPAPAPVFSVQRQQLHRHGSGSKCVWKACTRHLRFRNQILHARRS